MIARLAGLALVTLVGAGVLLQLRGSVRLVTWQLVVLIALVVLVRGRWPDRRRKVGALIELPEVTVGAPRPLAELELQIAGALSDRLTGDRPLRRRLRALAEQRVGVELNDDEGRRLLGDEAWDELTRREGPMTSAAVAEALTRIEEL